MGLKELKKLAKSLEYILGRRPDEFGLVPDRKGYVKIKEFLKALSETDGLKKVRIGSLKEIQLSLSPSPFEMDDKLIRAKERHFEAYSYAESVPNLLYTQVREKAYPSVAAKGLYSSGDGHIILCKDKEMAERIGRRKDKKAVILEVSTGLAKDEGAFFYTAGPLLYLTKYLSKDCIFGPALPKEKQEKRKKKKEIKDIVIPDPFEEIPAEDYIPDGKKGSWKRDKKRFRKEKRKIDH